MRQVTRVDCGGDVLASPVPASSDHRKRRSKRGRRSCAARIRQYQLFACKRREQRRAVRSMRSDGASITKTVHSTSSGNSSPSVVSLENPLRSPGLASLVSRTHITAFHETNRNVVSHRIINFISWNVQSLVQTDGEDIRICSPLASGARKLDDLIHALSVSRVDIAFVQETKWFGDFKMDVVFGGGGVWSVISSSRPLPSAGQPRNRGEGVAVILSPAFTEMLSDGKIIVTPISSRMISCTMSSCDQIFYFLCVYAPTAGRSGSVIDDDQDDFLRELDDHISTLPENYCKIICGDFNAEVGSRSFEQSLGSFGHGTCTDAGRKLLNFCSSNNLCIAGSFFPKRHEKHKITHQRNATNGRCIDHWIVQRDRLGFCNDVQAVENLVFGHFTDHVPLLIKLKLPFNADVRRAGRQCRSRAQNWKSLQLSQVKQAFNSNFKNRMNENASPDDVELQWQKIKGSLVAALSETVPVQRKHKEWFRASEQSLVPLRDACYQSQRRYLDTRSEDCRQLWSQARSAYKNACANAKDTWLASMAENIKREVEQKGSGAAWDGIAKIKSVFAGRKPARIQRLKKPDGSTCSTEAEEVEVAANHVETGLNKIFDYSRFNEIKHLIRQRPQREELAANFSDEEFEIAVGRLKPSTAPGKSGIRTEALKALLDDGKDVIKSFLRKLWTGACLVQDFKDALITMLPKKGDLSSIKNWRNISLLEVVGKLMALLVLGRLENLVESELPEEQCAYRRGRRCEDLIFWARSYIEKVSCSEGEKGVLTFVDFSSAFDSIPRVIIDDCLSLLGAPQHLVNLVMQFHTGNRVTVKMGSAESAEFTTSSGLRQGDCLAGCLFNIVVALMIEVWKQRIPKHDERWRSSPRNLSESPALLREMSGDCYEPLLAIYADDIADASPDLETAVKKLENMIEISGSFGLVVNLAKTKIMIIGADSVPVFVDVAGGQIEIVDHFDYLGARLHCSGKISSDVDLKIQKGFHAFGALRSILSDRDISLTVRSFLYSACVISVVFYGSGMWGATQKDVLKMRKFHRHCIRIITNVGRRQQREQRIYSQDLLSLTNLPDVEDILLARRLGWLGHVCRMANYRLPKLALYSWVNCAKARKGPRSNWSRMISADLRSLGVGTSWQQQATSENGKNWKTLIEDAVKEQRLQRIAETNDRRLRTRH
jgi:hypothetical protein